MVDHFFGLFFEKKRNYNSYGSTRNSSHDEEKYRFLFICTSGINFSEHL